MMVIELPERPEPEDCQSLSFDAYSGVQMLAYGRVCAELAHASGKLEAAQHILDMWRQPWGVAGRPFIKLLEAYVEELK